MSELTELINKYPSGDIYLNNQDELCNQVFNEEEEVISGNGRNLIDAHLEGKTLAVEHASGDPEKEGVKKTEWGEYVKVIYNGNYDDALTDIVMRRI